MNFFLSVVSKKADDALLDSCKEGVGVVTIASTNRVLFDEVAESRIDLFGLEWMTRFFGRFLNVKNVRGKDVIFLEFLIESIFAQF